MKEIYLINAIMYEMEQLGNTDVSIDNYAIEIVKAGGVNG